MGSGLLDPGILVTLRDELGADFIDARVQRYYSELVVLDNGVVRELSINSNQGIGVRVIVKGAVGYSSTNSLEEAGVKEAVLRAYRVAKASSKHSIQVDFYRRPTLKGEASSRFNVDPEDVDFSEKIELLKSMDSVARSVKGVASVILRYGYEADRRVYISSNGDHVEYSKKMLGVSARLVAHVEGTYETLYDQESGVAGWELIKGLKWDDWISERARLVVDTARAGHAKPGKYDIVLDNDMVGLMLHEAFGHASEGDTVLAGGSVLRGKIGGRVASELVTIADEGLVDGGDFVPYDDEGTPKRKVHVVKNGVLTEFLHSIITAKLLDGEPTGNARVMSYRYPVLVRQTNTYMEPLDWGAEEMIRDMRRGLYVKGLGALGGEVNPLTGAFTFTSGPSYIVENGEPAKLVKGVMLSGLILETLKSVDAVGKDLLVRTSVFGGCGKDGQTVRVGDGGPHVRVRGFIIGGG
ncbi:MAG: TldD/PmbA family protein [Desulfurococcaceae archaeon]